MEIATTSRYSTDSMHEDSNLDFYRPNETSNSNCGKQKAGSRGDSFSFHNVRMLEEFRDMWNRGEFCDISLKVGDITFPVHKLLLSVKSSYFRALFDSCDPCCKEIVIKDLTSLDMDQLINYCYTGRYEINTDNVQDTFILADRFAFITLLDSCVRYMISHTDIDNCLSLLSFAQRFSCPRLLNAVQGYVWSNFQPLAERSTDFLAISLPSLVDLLRSEELNVRSEEKAFEAIVRWISHDPGTRKIHIVPLLKSIRLGLIDINYFVGKVKTCPYIKDVPECKPIIKEALRFICNLKTISSADDSCTDMDGEEILTFKPKLAEHRNKRKINHGTRKRGADLTTQQDPSNSLVAEEVEESSCETALNLKHPFAKPRLPHEIMFVIGGWSGGSPTSIAETYDTRADRWVRCPALEPREPRAYHGLISLDRKIYMIGGFNGDDYYNTCKVLEPGRLRNITQARIGEARRTEDLWTEIAPMNSARCYVSVAALGGSIYAMGGFDGHARLNTAERYDPSRNQWTPIFPMHYQRSDASAAVLRDRIYIAGGFNGQECMCGAEYYDPTNNTWTLISCMNVKRSGVGVVALHDKLYALGGFNGISRMATAERYDPDSGSWESLPEMNHPRSNFACEVIDEMVFVVGGFNGVSTIYHVECFNDESNEWFEATDMNLYRSALSACVISNLPNRNEFIHKNRQNLLEEKRNRMQNILTSRL